MAQDRLTVIAQMKFEKQPFSPFERATEKVKNHVEKLESRTKKLQGTATKTGKNLNKMLDDYNKRGTRADSVSMKLAKRVGFLAGAYLSVGKAVESVKLASSMEETQNKLNVVFGDLAENATNWADNYAKTLGFSQLKTKEALGDIQNLFTGFGMGRMESSDLAKQIVQLGNDLDSFNNLSSRGVDVQKTLQSALMGQTESAKTLGASLLETQLNVASMEMGLGKYNNKWDEATKIQVRLHAIMMQSKDAIGDVGRTLDTETAIRRRFNAEVENTQVQIGQKLIPLQLTLLKTGLRLTEMIQNNTDKIDMFTGAISKTISIGGRFLELLTGATVQSRLLQGVVGTLTAAYVTYKAAALGAFLVNKAHTTYLAAKTIPTLFMQNAAIIKTAVAWGAQKLALYGVIAATKIVTAAQWALNIALSANPIGLVIAGVVALGAAFVLAYKKIEPFQKLIDKVYETVKSLGSKAISVIFGTKSESSADNGGQVSKRAQGGQASGMTLVGEQGPELVNLPSGSSVINNTSTMNKMGGNSVSVGGDTINISISGSNTDSNELVSKIKDVIRTEKRRSEKRTLSMLQAR